MDGWIAVSFAHRPGLGIAPKCGRFCLYYHDGALVLEDDRTGQAYPFPAGFMGVWEAMRKAESIEIDEWIAADDARRAGLRNCPRRMIARYEPSARPTEAAGEWIVDDVGTVYHDGRAIGNVDEPRHFPMGIYGARYIEGLRTHPIHEGSGPPLHQDPESDHAGLGELRCPLDVLGDLLTQFRLFEYYRRLIDGTESNEEAYVARYPLLPWLESTLEDGGDSPGDGGTSRVERPPFLDSDEFLRRLEES